MLAIVAMPAFANLYMPYIFHISSPISKVCLFIKYVAFMSCKISVNLINSLKMSYVTYLSCNAIHVLFIHALSIPIHALCMFNPYAFLIYAYQ